MRIVRSTLVRRAALVLGGSATVREVLALADEARQLASLSPEMRQWMKHMEEARQAQVPGPPSAFAEDLSRGGVMRVGVALA